MGKLTGWADREKARGAHHGGVRVQAGMSAC